MVTFTGLGRAAMSGNAKIVPSVVMYGIYDNISVPGNFRRELIISTISGHGFNARGGYSHT
jgi:hypothetical protein